MNKINFLTISDKVSVTLFGENYVTSSMIVPESNDYLLSATFLHPFYRKFQFITYTKRYQETDEEIFDIKKEIKRNLNTVHSRYNDSLYYEYRATANDV
ncbi:hypothetical protein BpHYR1_040574 [Brachionus plicatilis]|uniref:Uncharacterized protein n=1 Tax=Brachionus plicatilis TaxID=10195 RepID=A0A3M7RHI9_BRAPC|nr:hypothetical protein BpHYR1_040574 [Brachionus plicatilis]